jgi:hypothetical protein
VEFASGAFQNSKLQPKQNKNMIHRTQNFTRYPIHGCEKRNEEKNKETKNPSRKETRKIKKVCLSKRDVANPL